MSWCPDPKCGCPIADDRWTVQDLATEYEPFDAERGECWLWRATCPGCGMRISAWHGASDALPTTPSMDDWCCPLCGGAALLVGENRGPVAAALRCKDGCGSVASMHLPRRRAE